jgi:hypothetical protein
MPSAIPRIVDRRGDDSTSIAALGSSLTAPSSSAAERYEYVAIPTKCRTRAH